MTKYALLVMMILVLGACGDDGGGGADGGGADGGAADGGPEDSGGPDATPTDSGAPDGGDTDAGLVDGGGGDGAPPGCTPGLTMCGDVCVDTATDAAHCGGCDQACAPDFICVASVCTDPAACDPPGAPAESGVTLGAVSGDAEEGGAAVSYTVVLDAAPCAGVAVTVTGDAQVEALPPSLLFTPANWNTPQTVQVQAVHDFEQEGDHTGTVSHVAVSSDTSYGGLVIDDATIQLLDRAHITHISVALGGTGADGASSSAAVSDDGRWVAFGSEAANLVGGDTGGIRDVFLRDTVTGTTLRLNVGPAGEADGPTYRPRIAGDGSSVLFVSEATNLSTPAATTAEIYRWSVAGLTRLTTPCSGCTDGILAFDLSADGTHVAYSTARPMLPADTDTAADYYTLRLSDGALTLDSLGSSDANSIPSTYPPMFTASTPHLSSGGEHVTFASSEIGLASPDIGEALFQVYSKDRTTRTLSRASAHDDGITPCQRAASAPPGGSGGASQRVFVADDGNFVVFSSSCGIRFREGPGGEPTQLAKTTSFYDIFVRDIATQTTTRISLAPDGAEADGSSTSLGITGDGRFILFTSSASNLVVGDTNGAEDAFLYDRTTGEIRRVSYGTMYDELPTGIVEPGSEVVFFGVIGSGPTAGISSTGDFVVFTTLDNLLPTDDNVDTADIYLVQLR